MSGPAIAATEVPAGERFSFLIRRFDKHHETVELFLAPGVGHCAGGAGPDQVDLLKALSTWVESGTPPSRQNLVLSKQDKSGEPVMTRPMCKYPAWPRYKGTGDVTAASSFECSME